jgi:hypothetical protein
MITIFFGIHYPILAIIYHKVLCLDLFGFEMGLRRNHKLHPIELDASGFSKQMHKSCAVKAIYHLVNVYITMENHHFWLVKSSISMTIFNSYVSLPEGTDLSQWNNLIYGMIITMLIPLKTIENHL